MRLLHNGAMTTKTTLVTGANRGIGLELCRLLRARGERVIAVCRSASPELEALGVQIEAGVDVSDNASLIALGQRLQGVRLDTLIANAGILRSEDLGKLDYDSIEAQWQTNALGPLRTVEALLPALSHGSKIALITSRMGSIGDNASGGYYGYRMSKAALNAAGMSLARDLLSQGIAVITLHPGFVRTQMTGGHGGIEPAESAKMLIARIDALTLQTTGKFLHANGETLPW
jgi:NAD(P)-dependent dehydrogenase (short-subunit alcohol dehydrogenase family)